MEETLSVDTFFHRESIVDCLRHSMGEFPLNWSIGTIFTGDHLTAFARGRWSLLQQE